jgi:DNA-binding NarL/FixJ family response regulator
MGDYGNHRAGVSIFSKIGVDIVLLAYQRRVAVGKAAGLSDIGYRIMDGKRDMTPRQRQVAELVRKGESNKGIGRELHLSPRTIKVFVSQLFAKFDVHNRTSLAVSPGLTLSLD